jgi:hypothetical protein
MFRNVVTPMERSNPLEPKEPVQPSVVPDEKFKGFEVFLDIENEKDIAVPKSMLKN